MSQYRITRRVESVEGYQSWLVNADSAEDAARKYEAGDSEFEEEDLNVMALGEPEIKEVPA